jgi:hypothetical protein
MAETTRQQSRRGLRAQPCIYSHHLRLPSPSGNPASHADPHRVGVVCSPDIPPQGRALSASLPWASLGSVLDEIILSVHGENRHVGAIVFDVAGGLGRH